MLNAVFYDIQSRFSKSIALCLREDFFDMAKPKTSLAVHSSQVTEEKGNEQSPIDAWMSGVVTILYSDNGRYFLA